MKKAGSIIDYALLVVAAAAVFIIMGTYVKRSIAGGIKDGVDVFSHGRQYQGQFIKPGD